MDENRRLNIGDSTQISVDVFQEQPEIGKEYLSPIDSSSWILVPSDGLKDKPCVVRIDNIEDGICHCTVTQVLRDR